MVELSGAGVVEVGEGAFRQFLHRHVVLGQDAVGIAGHHFRFANHQVGGADIGQTSPPVVLAAPV